MLLGTWYAFKTSIWLQIRLVFPQVLFAPHSQLFFYDLFYAREDLVGITCRSWPLAYSRNGRDGAEELSAARGVWQKSSPVAALSESPRSTLCSATDCLGDHEKVAQFWQVPHRWNGLHGLVPPRRGVVRTQVLRTESRGCRWWRPSLVMT